MTKLLAVIAMVAIIWAGMKIYTEGAEHAFGGAFSFLTWGDDLPDRATEAVSNAKRVGEAVDQRIREGAARYEQAEP